MRNAAARGRQAKHYYTAEWWNRQSRNKQPNLGSGFTLQHNPAIVLGVRTSGTADPVRFDAVGISESLVQTTDPDDDVELLSSIAVGLDTDDFTNDDVGIVQGPLPETGDSAKVVTTGLTWARIYVNSDSDDFVTVVSNRLETDSSGIGRIIQRHTDWAETETHYGLILLRGGGSGNSYVHAKTPVAGIPAKSGTGESGSPYVYGSATCDLIDPSTGLRYSPNRTRTIKNQVNVAIPGEIEVGACEGSDGNFYIVVGDCST
jgi:hypothetical protein